MIINNRSFLFGILCASLTWAISIYLYWQLTSNNEATEYTKKPARGDLINSGILAKKSNVNNEIPESYEHGMKNSKQWAKDKVKKVYKVHANEKNVIKSISKNDEEFDTGYGLINNPQDRMIRDEGYKLHAFNTLASMRIGDFRDVPDTRNELCKTKTYPNKLPDASIIICFYNEHYETLRRSIQSILDRTPRVFLKEIVLVDDFSDIENLHENVQNYIVDLRAKLEKEMFLSNNDVLGNDAGVQIKMLKTSRREGLIRARVFGADNSQGQVLIFLDSHIEVNQDWIEPLLARLSENVTSEEGFSKRVVMPIIDVINADTFHYKSSPLVRGGFNWGLHFKWDNIPRDLLKDKKDFIKPFKSPTMAGGLFAIYRDYFNRMGKYDTGMDTWGGENLELSFRIWMCGGVLEIIPCSRVGHVFRKRRPYSSPEGGDSMTHNSLRLAHVWMDTYVEKYLKTNPDAVNVKYGNITERINLRNTLGCKSFQWYLDNVYPEMILDTDNENKVKQKMDAVADSNNKYQPWFSRQRNYIDSYQLRLTNTSLCIQAAKDVKTKGSGLILTTCSRTINQIWHETILKELVLGRLLCLDSNNFGKQNPILSKCHEMAGTQEWNHKPNNGAFIYNSASGTCLGVDTRLRGAPIIMKICTPDNFIFWDFLRS